MGGSKSVNQIQRQETNEEELVFYNTHIHLMSHKDIPDMWLGSITKLIHNEHCLTKLIYILGHISSKLMRISKIRQLIERVKLYAQIGQSSINDRLGILSLNYKKSVGKRLYGYSKIHFFAISMDQEYMEGGILPGARKYQDQLKDLIQLRKNGVILPNFNYRKDNLGFRLRRKIPRPQKDKTSRNRIKIDLSLFLHIDPQRFSDKKGNLKKQMLVDFLTTWIKTSKFVGIKLYPPLGVFPWDVRLEFLYEYCIDKNIPILVHTSKSAVFNRGDPAKIIELIDTPVKKFLAAHGNNPFEKTFLDEFNRVYSFLCKKYRNLIDEYDKCKKASPGKLWIYKYLRNKDITSIFTEPVNWKVVLHKYPNLKLLFCHFGGNEEISTHYRNYLRNPKSNWYAAILQLMREKKKNGSGKPELKYPNLFADISGGWKPRDLRYCIGKIVEEKETKEKILFGTDYYMTSIKPSEKTFLKILHRRLSKKQIRRITYDNPRKF